MVARHRPWTALLQLIAVLGSIVVAGYLAYAYGRATVSIEYTAVRSEREKLQDRNEKLAADNTALREHVAVLERGVQIDRRAYQDVDKYLVGLQNEIFALKEEVAFYRGIVSSDRGKGLRIQSFDVKRDGDGGDYRYQLVLTQDMKSDKVVSGTVNLSVAGEQAGRAAQLSSGDFEGGRGSGVEFQFKYFQKIEGRITLPQDFAPRSVSVQVTATGEQKRITEQTFDWPQPVG